MGEHIQTSHEGMTGLEQARLLTEVDHLYHARRPDGSFDQKVSDGVLTNLMSLVQEAAMPHAVTTTFHPVAETGPAHDRRRTFSWLGRSALQVAESGYAFHESAAGLERVAIEVAEARRAETELHDDVQVFISPRMTLKDAPREIALKEHMADDDAVRISLPVKNKDGQLIGRAMQSLLIRDIPLAAWVAMLRDPANPFGRSFKIDDENSALGIMRLFDQLDVPADALPEGPVSLVATVSRYIDDHETRHKVEGQLERFRGDQLYLEIEAYKEADNLLSFSKQLAESLYQGQATYDVRRFIHIMANQWNQQDLAFIMSHEQAGHFRMSRPLAALLSKANQHIKTRDAGVRTGNDRMLSQLSEQRKAEINRSQALIAYARASGSSREVIMHLEARNDRLIASSNIKGGGGCPGDTDMSFGGEKRDQDGRLIDERNESAERSNWTITNQKCNVPTCPTRPGVVKCGPCGVCMDRCQAIYDKGGDPMVGSSHAKAKQSEYELAA